MKKFILILILFSIVGFSACKEEGTLEKAGKKIDQAFKDAAEKLEKEED